MATEKESTPEVKTDHELIDDLYSAEESAQTTSHDEDEETEEEETEETEEKETEDSTEEETDEETEEEETEEEESTEEEGTEEETEEEETEEEETEEEETEEEELNIPPWNEQLRAYFPEREFNSNEDYQTATTELINGLHSQIDADMEANETLVQTFNDHPDILEAVRYLTKGYSSEAALAMAGILDSSLVSEDDTNYENVVKSKLDREKAKKEAAKQQETLKANEKKSQAAIREFQTSRKLTDAKNKEFMGKFEAFVDRVINLDIDQEMLDFMFSGFYAKELQAKAQDQGRIQGRNEKIKINKAKKNGDGIPKLNSQGVQAKKDGPKYADDFDRMLDTVLKDA